MELIARLSASMASPCRPSARALPELGRAARLHQEPALSVDRYEAYPAWVLRKNESDECKRANKPYRSDPDLPPQ